MYVAISILVNNIIATLDVKLSSLILYIMIKVIYFKMLVPSKHHTEYMLFSEHFKVCNVMLHKTLGYK